MERQDFNNSIDFWLDNEDNARLHQNTRQGLVDMPWLLAFDICNNFLLPKYQVIASQQLSELRESAKKEKELVNRIDELEEVLENLYNDDSYKGDIVKVLLDGDNYTKCDRCETIVHKGNARNKRDRTYCEQCIEEV